MRPFLLALLLSLGFLTACPTPPGVISGDEAKAKVQAGALLLDVRTPEEFAETHIKGATLIPVTELREQLGKLPDKDRPIVVYCRTGRRSRMAKRMLEEAGYQTVFDLGARTNW